MNKETRLKKRLVALFLVLLLSIESFGAVVSDNDGSAFITKAEFDSLKNNFQSQIDQYNTSIDSKIDGAIASYLSGISVKKTEDLMLDANCGYTFPLVSIQNSEWNTSGDYFNVSVPSFFYCKDQLIFELMPKYDSERSEPIKAISGGNYLQPGSMTFGSERGILFGYGSNQWSFTGAKNQLFILGRTTDTRNINGITRKTFTIVKKGIGNLNLTYVEPMDGKNLGTGLDLWSRAGWYIYPRFMGFDGQMVDVTVVNKGQVSPKSSFTKSVWNDRQLKASGFGVTLDIGNLFPIQPSGTTLRTYLNNWNTWANSNVGNTHGNAGQSMCTSPISVIDDFDSTNSTNQVFSGDAFVHGQIAKKWALEPLGSTVDEIKINSTYLNDGMKAGWLAIANPSGHTGMYTVAQQQHWLFSDWHAVNNTTFSDQTSDDFSSIRASLITYTDSKDKKHYLDEGMFLGTFNKDGEVQFTLRFRDTGSQDVNFALSKKPFSYDASTSDRIAFKFKNNTDVTDFVSVSAGNYGTLSANKEVKFVIENISKNDELYFLWWPDTASHYVEMEYFKDFSISSED